MIQLGNVKKSFGERILFEGLTLQLTPRERLGLVGRNGYGKSTLFRMILGQEEADEGSIAIPRNYRIGHLEQHLHWTEKTVLEEAALGLPEDERLYPYKAESILFGLGFVKDDMQRNPHEFSGGYQIRINLAKLLVSEPNLLLLDEPTNYLDIVSIRWMIPFLRSWQGELILISHDRDFMDQVTTHTAIIHRGKLRKVVGDTEKLYSQIAEDEERYEKNRINEQKRRREIELFVNRFKAQASKAAAVQSRVKMLEKMGEKEALQNIQELDFKFRYAPFEAKNVMDVHNLTFGYDPHHPLISGLNFQVKNQDRIAIIGKNGRGKSTLLSLLVGEHHAQAGTIKTHHGTQIGYFGQTNIARLDTSRTIEQEIQTANETLNRTQVRSICGLMMFEGDDAEKKISILSGGEKSRVLLGKILATPNNLLLLDEPTNHLDMSSIEALMESLDVFPGAILLVTHSERLLRSLKATKLIVFQNGYPELFLGSYDEFLERVGWDDGDEKKKTPASAPEAIQEERLSKKELKKRRAEVVDEKSKTLNPLKKEIQKLESDISTLEEKKKSIQNDLAQASQPNGQAQVEAVVRLSRELKDADHEMDDKLIELESLTQDLEQKTKFYEDLLNSLQ